MSEELAVGVKVPHRVNRSKFIPRSNLKKKVPISLKVAENNP